MPDSDKDWIDQRQGEQAAGGGGSGSDAARAAAGGADAVCGTAEQAQATFREHIAEPAARAGEAMRDGGQRAADQGMTIGTKLIDQAQANSQEAFAAMRAAAGAKDLGEVMRIQADYLREQGNRSMAQSREIGELIMAFGRQAVAPFGGRTKD